VSPPCRPALAGNAYDGIGVPDCIRSAAGGERSLALGFTADHATAAR